MTPEHLMRTLYLAAENAGLLSTCVWQGPAVGQDAVVTQTHAVSLRASDEGVLDGLALSTHYTITYPASTGRNFHEILRVIDSLQLTDNHKVATPANWRDGDEVVIVPSLKDEDEIKRRFPKGYRAVKPYLRLTPQPNK